MVVHILAHTIYTLLLVIALACLANCIRIGLIVDRTHFHLHPILYVLHVSIFGLSVIQVYQTVILLLSPISMMWWIPLFCKGSSLLTYFVFLEFIKWRHNHDYETYRQRCLGANL